jgi:acyl-CoA synthetase (NDP forming)
MILLCMMFASANRSSAGIWKEEIRRFEKAGIPNYPTPERAARALANLCRLRDLMRGKMTFGIKED